VKTPGDVVVYRGPELEAYAFQDGHPFGPHRLDRFWESVERLGLDRQVRFLPPVVAPRADLERFHTPDYVDRVARLSVTGDGILDAGDTPAFRGVFEAASAVVGTVVDAAVGLVEGRWRRAFVPTAGLHHALRHSAGGFCVFSDIGVAVEVLRARHGIRRIAYVDVDAHHGDGVLYSFEDDPDLWIADIHEDGRFLYPGTGFRHETGAGAAAGTKLNLPLLPGADDRHFLAALREALAHVDAARPELVILQCGADGLAGDPLTHLAYSTLAHTVTANALCALADAHCGGRLLALGGGGYDPDNIAAAWCAVLTELAASGGEAPHE
jgi:acetoin utilization protein AcuC